MRPLLALVPMLLLIPGCQTAGWLQTHPEAAQIVVQQATLRFIGQDAWAEAWEEGPYCPPPPRPRYPLCRTPEDFARRWI